MREVTIAYGMTETSPVSFQTAPDDPLERRVSTVGRVQPHLEVKIVDAEGRIVPRGAPGELCTRGYSVMLGYWDDAERTAEAIDAEGWMHTGDLATIDAEGYVQHRRPHQGHGDPRRREHLSARDRGVPLPPPEDRRRAGGRRARRPKYGEELCAWVRLRAGESADARRRSAPSAAARSPTTRSRATSASSTRSR